MLVLLLLFGRRSELVAAWHQLSQRRAPGWLVAAVAAEATVAVGVRLPAADRVLRLAGVRVPLPGLVLLTLANDAIANTVPGEPAVSSAFRYRYYRRRGADGASAGWTIFTILIAQAIGMSLLLLLGVLVALAGSGPAAAALGVAVVGLIIVAGALRCSSAATWSCGWLVPPSAAAGG